jgi:hypothetical protein
MPKILKIRLALDCPKTGESVPVEGSCLSFHPVDGKWRKGYVNLLGGEGFYSYGVLCEYFRGLEHDRKNYPTGVTCGYEKPPAEKQNS